MYVISSMFVCAKLTHKKKAFPYNHLTVQSESYYISKVINLVV